MASKIISLSSLEDVQNEVSILKRRGLRLGFVPTMGYLHEGHLSLVEISNQKSDLTFVSIFVNPTQFNDPKDLDVYPRDLPRDLQLLETAGTHAVFLPTPAMMYGHGFESWVSLDKLPLEHEGAFRPGHFKGVSTVVAMLFNIVQPDVAVFGEKDFQQLRLIEQMVEDLKYPLEILRGPIVRESDGLAMSSRNVRLSPSARATALSISKGLFAARATFQQGERRSSVLCSIVEQALKHSDVKVDYIHLVDECQLNMIETIAGHCRLLVAASVGGVRLIDNIELSV